VAASIRQQHFSLHFTATQAIEKPGNYVRLLGRHKSSWFLRIGRGIRLIRPVSPRGVVQQVFCGWISRP
jgi:hypothetical protein